ncbi:MAG: molybdopterin molybdotransferase MoeA [Planctomycetaceae bacterium]|nr:molybdopterin molybdotransferase MoeA [Planctomycetaceae bacterium]
MSTGSLHDDVRMRGFAARSTVEQAIRWVDEQTPVLASVSEPLSTAHGRVLAEDVVATFDVPPFVRSAMDGFAVRAEETAGAGLYNPLTFPVSSQSLPGRPAPCPLGTGQAIRIMTGAPVPFGATAVVPAESAREMNGLVEIIEPLPVGKNIGRIGEDIAAETTVLRQGRRLRPQDVGVLASLGMSHVTVVRQPRIRIVITGDELATPGEPRGPHQIYEANSPMLYGLATRDGGRIDGVERLPDDRAAIRAALSAPGADVVLVSGGTSVGAEDHAPSLVAELGELAIHGIAMRPSSPTGMGRIGKALVFLLPGNPVSCLCAYDFFAGRAIRRQGGRSSDWSYRRSTEVVGRKIVSSVGRVDYCRIRREGSSIVPLAVSGASVLSSTTRADGFVVIRAESEGHAPGEDVTVMWYDAAESQ